MTNKLYYGDNLSILRNQSYFPNECIDLIYLDPPFNSNRNYSVPSSKAQIRAFTDTWKWDNTARRQFDEVIEQGGNLAKAMLSFPCFKTDTKANLGISISLRKR